MDAAPVEEEEAAAEVLIEGDAFVIDVVGPDSIEALDEVSPAAVPEVEPEAEAEADTDGVIVTCAGTAGPVELGSH